MCTGQGLGPGGWECSGPGPSPWSCAPSSVQRGCCAGGAAGDDVYKASGTVETFSQWRWLLVSTLSHAGDLASLPPVSLSLPSVDREVAPLALSSLWAEILSVCFSAGLSWGIGSGSPCKQNTPSPLPALPPSLLEAPPGLGEGGWQGGGRAQPLSPDQPDGQLPGAPQALEGLPYEHRLHLAALLPLLSGRCRLPLLRHLAVSGPSASGGRDGELPSGAAVAGGRGLGGVEVAFVRAEGSSCPPSSPRVKPSSICGPFRTLDTMYEAGKVWVRQLEEAGPGVSWLPWIHRYLVESAFPIYLASALLL